MKNSLLFLLLIGALSFTYAQEGFVLVDGVKKEKIAFEQHSNLIVIPVVINDVSFNFILDTGATRTILFNLKGIDSLNINQGKYIKVNGYGDKDALNAYYSQGNTISIGSHIKNKFADVLVLSDSEIDLSPKLDIEVHGLLSVDFLNNFVTHIDYENSYLKVYKEHKHLPSYLRKADQFDLSFKNKRPIINVGLNTKLVRDDYELLLDTGSGDALWILNEVNRSSVFKNSFEDHLGFGLNGEIYGLRTKVNSIHLFNSTLIKVAVSYPYKEYYNVKNTKTSHDGSLGGEVLRRFDVVFDFPNKKIKMIPNRDFEEGFYYNMSGLGVQKGGVELFALIERDFSKSSNNGYSDKGVSGAASVVSVSTESRLIYQYVPKIYVDYVRKDSPGDKAGIKIDDQIVSINGYNQKQLTLSLVSELFFKNPYKKLRIKLKRGDKEFTVEIINVPLVF